MTTIEYAETLAGLKSIGQRLDDICITLDFVTPELLPAEQQAQRSRVANSIAHLNVAVGSIELACLPSLGTVDNFSFSLIGLDDQLLPTDHKQIRIDAGSFSASPDTTRDIGANAQKVKTRSAVKTTFGYSTDFETTSAAERLVYYDGLQEDDLPGQWARYVLYGRATPDTIKLRDIRVALSNIAGSHELENEEVMARFSKLNQYLTKVAEIRESQVQPIPLSPEMTQLVRSLLASSFLGETNCAGMDFSIFFPQDVVGVKRAQQICRSCPSKEQCLEYALEHHIEHGVWGGTSERGRRRLARQRRKERKAIENQAKE